MYMKEDIIITGDFLHCFYIFYLLFFSYMDKMIIPSRVGHSWS